MSSDTEGMQQLVVVNSVEASYGKAQALFDISFEIKEGDVLGIIGPNGAGKTTLLDCLTGFKSFDGSIAFRGDSVRDKKPWSVAGGIGYATEEGNLFDDLSVFQNLKMGSYTSRDAFSQNAQRVYELFPRLEQRKEQTARTLSGGEQQMLAIGRALMSDPGVLLVDEPTEGLMPSLVDDLQTILSRVNDAGVTMLLVEQNVDLALEISDYGYVIDEGRIQTQGNAETLRADEEVKERYLALGVQD